METEKEFWHPPPKGYLKCNIGGASKCNPRIAGYGGVLRDEEVNIIYIFHCHLAKATKNMAELMALEHCLELLILNHSSNVIIEADSEISINAIKRIGFRASSKKVSKHWRLIQVYQRIHKHLLSLRTVSFSHVRSEANKLADTLANQGVFNTECRIEMKWQEMPQDRLKALCKEQEEDDREIFNYWAREKRTE